MKGLIYFIISLHFSTAFSAETEDLYSADLTDSSPLINKMICERLELLENYYNAKIDNNEKLQREVIVMGQGLFLKDIKTEDQLKKDIIRKSRNGLKVGLPAHKFVNVDGEWKDEGRPNVSFIPDSLDESISGKSCYEYENSLTDNIYSDLGKIKQFLIEHKLPILDNWGANGIQNVFQVGNAYISTDKLTHFFNEGSTYLFDSEENDGTYNLKEGELKSINSELSYFGLKTSGVFSFADLEANRQGARFLYNLVYGDNPAFSVKKDNTGAYRVRLNYCPDVKNYFSLKMSEVFNPNFYSSSINEAMTKGIQNKINNRSKALKLDLNKQFPSCVDIKKVTDHEKKLIQKIKDSASQKEVNELAALWAVCPEKLSFSGLLDDSKKLDDSVNEEDVSKILNQRNKLVDKFI